MKLRAIYPSFLSISRSNYNRDISLCRSTHAWELDAAVTALGGSALLLNVEVPKLAAGGLDDADLVGPRVVPVDRNSSILSKKFPSRLFLRS